MTTTTTTDAKVGRADGAKENDHSQADGNGDGIDYRRTYSIVTSARVLDRPLFLVAGKVFIHGNGVEADIFGWISLRISKKVYTFCGKIEQVNDVLEDEAKVAIIWR